MEIDRDDLAQLPAALPEALAVFPSRRVPVPPRLRAKTLPLAVERRTTHAWGLEASGALACCGAFDARGQGTRVAVLDTGVAPTHPDPARKIAKFVEFGFKGEVVREGLKDAWDAEGHGTHVCGTIAGGRASGRWIGMAPDAKLLVAKVLGKSGGTDEQIPKGMEWAVANGAEVINMVLGGLSFDPGVLDTYTAAVIAARSAGVPVVVAIGNDGAQTSGSPGNDFFSLAVGEMDIDDRAAHGTKPTTVQTEHHHVNIVALIREHLDGLKVDAEFHRHAIHTLPASRTQSRTRARGKSRRMFTDVHPFTQRAAVSDKGQLQGRPVISMYDLTPRARRNVCPRHRSRRPLVTATVRPASM